MTDADAHRALHKRAYAAMDSGALAEASRLFSELLRLEPGDADYHYMHGLAHKYLLDWPVSLQHNLQAIELLDEVDQAAHWNAAIAATALGDWSQARALWSACGVRVPEGSGPIVGDYGIAVVRLNPWQGGETVFARRIDPVRARLLNVPLTESGHRFGDLVLHDGAATGHRHDGEHQVPVFNELARVAPSDFQTFVVFVRCDSAEALQPLLEAKAPGIGFAEDWTASVHPYCLRCSYGTPHRHDRVEDGWQAQRNLGFAAQGRASVDKVLRDWAAGGRDRHVESVETREVQPPSRDDGHAWWVGPQERDSTAPPGDDDSTA